jgi:heme-degrading monooxygenase HmoA
MTTLTLFRYPTSQIFWAFTQMQLAHSKLGKTRGLKFYKLMGSGSAGGFGLWPNWRVYALLSIWESIDDFKRFQAEQPFAQETLKRSSEQMTTFLKPIRTHGLWDGINPFEPLVSSALVEDAEVAVLTRARIKLRRLPDFLINTPAAKVSLLEQKDLLLSIGIGETPLIYQATFSIWRNIDAVQKYAYRTPAHSDVVRKTRERDWYSEEMFTRFQVLGNTGSWAGKTYSELPHTI